MHTCPRHPLGCWRCSSCLGSAHGSHWGRSRSFAASTYRLQNLKPMMHRLHCSRRCIGGHCRRNHRKRYRSLHQNLQGTCCRRTDLPRASPCTWPWRSHLHTRTTPVPWLRGKPKPRRAGVFQRERPSEEMRLFRREIFLVRCTCACYVCCHGVRPRSRSAYGAAEFECNDRIETAVVNWALVFISVHDGSFQSLCVTI